MDFAKLTRKLEGLEKASRNGFRVRNLHEIMRLDELWYLAYTNIYSNTGAMTKGIDEVTLDGFSVKRVHKLINSLKADTYKPKPARRAYIPKRDGKMRPLGVPSGDDKLVQSVIKILLEQIYEPIFYDFSHGFRPNKSCHTALKQVQKTWTGTKWLIEYDIKGFFDNMNHDTMIELLEKKIDDKRFIKLTKALLKAGYLEDWKYHRTYSGTPQGGIISPVLSNIYLHELDGFMANLITEFNVGKRRPVSPEHRRVSSKIERWREKLRKSGVAPNTISELKALQKEQKTLPSKIENTDEYKRLRYCRYADDFICGVAGSYGDARMIMQSVEDFLKENLYLQLSPEKTGIERLIKGIEFLSYEIRTFRVNRTVKQKLKDGKHRTQRTLTGKIVLSVPERKVRDFCKKYGYGNWQSMKSIHRPYLIKSSEVEIVEAYNAELRGLANYYSLAGNVKSRLRKLFYLALYSLFKTIASKRKRSLTNVVTDLKRPNEHYLRYRFKDEWKTIRIFQLKHMSKSVETKDELPLTAYLFHSGTELIRRIEAEQCEYCGNLDKPVEVHHVIKLRDLKSKPHLERWEKVMIARNRKTLILCISCHNLLHQGKLPDMRQTIKV